MTDPEAALLTLMDPLTAKTIASLLTLWTEQLYTYGGDEHRAMQGFCVQPEVRAVLLQMLDLAGRVEINAPLLTPRAWQPMELREHIEDAIERERATEKEAQGGSILAAACSGAIEAYRSVLEQLPPAPKERP